MSNYLKVTEPTQQEPLTPTQVVNAAGGYVFAVDNWVRLQRFLILGTEGGTYYATERKLTADNKAVVLACLREDGARTVQMIVDISKSGRAPKNDVALYALAVCACYGDDSTRSMANISLPLVARTGTHLFQWAEFVNSMEGWSRSRRRAISSWYLDDHTPDQLAYQLAKYKQREGWSHRDLLRLAHPNFNRRTSAGQLQNALFRWAVDKYAPDKKGYLPNVDIVTGCHEITLVSTPKEAAKLVSKYKLTREMIPTEYLSEPEVWEALLPNTPLTGLIRNLGNLSKIGLLKALSSTEDYVIGRLRTGDDLRKARVHPIQVLSALLTYQSGHGARGKGEWTPCARVVDALDDAFYLSFGNLESTGKRFYLALDVSASMTGGTIAGVPGLSPNVGAAAMAMVAARTESRYIIRGFTSSGGGYYSRSGGSALQDLGITAKDSIEAACVKAQKANFGGTDCALPMLDAMKQNLEVDVFCIYTDNETWAGNVHPAAALQQYRKQSGIPAKLVVCGMTSVGYSIADPNDAGMLDVVGFDTATPALITDFAK